MDTNFINFINVAVIRITPYWLNLKPIWKKCSNVRVCLRVYFRRYTHVYECTIQFYNSYPYVLNNAWIETGCQWISFHSVSSHSVDISLLYVYATSDDILKYIYVRTALILFRQSNSFCVSRLLMYLYFPDTPNLRMITTNLHLSPFRKL